MRALVLVLRLLLSAVPAVAAAPLDDAREIARWLGERRGFTLPDSPFPP
jgi:hypothetical protein